MVPWQRVLAFHIKYAVKSAMDNGTNNGTSHVRTNAPRHIIIKTNLFRYLISISKTIFDRLPFVYTSHDWHLLALFVVAHSIVSFYKSFVLFLFILFSLFFDFASTENFSRLFLLFLALVGKVIIVIGSESNENLYSAGGNKRRREKQKRKWPLFNEPWICVYLFSKSPSIAIFVI